MILKDNHIRIPAYTDRETKSIQLNVDTDRTASFTYWVETVGNTHLL